jgi:hypothetical protein
MGQQATSDSEASSATAGKRLQIEPWGVSLRLPVMKPAFDSHSVRKFAFAVASAGTSFWLYTFYAIHHVPPGDGTGFQWLAVIPLGFIFIGFFLPAWFFIAIGRLPRLASILGLAGLIAFGIVWLQLLAEFPKR